MSEVERSPGKDGLGARISRSQFLRKAGLSAAALSSTQLLASCAFGGTGGQAGESEAKDISGSFDWKREEGATIRLLLNKHPYTDALLADLKSFKEKTGIDVQHDIFPEENYFDKVTLDLSSGQANYDAFMLGAYMVWQYGPPGWLEDLEPWIQNESATNPDYDWEDVLPNLRAADSWSFKVGDPLGTGGQWALPWGFETNAIAYRSDVFNKLGLKPAETLDELVELAAVLSEKAEGMYGIAVRGTRSWATIHPGFMTQYSRMGEEHPNLGRLPRKVDGDGQGFGAAQLDPVHLVPGWFRLGRARSCHDIRCRHQLLLPEPAGVYASGGQDRLAPRSQGA